MGNAAAAQAAAVAGRADDQYTDPWFTPEPKPEAGRDGHADQTFNGDVGQAEWFLPAGRAGLQPESMTVSFDEDEPRTDGATRAGAVGAPPWAGDVASPAAGEPPPWENGPWPGPGEREPGQPRARRVRAEAAEPAWTSGPQAVAARRPRRLLLAAGAGVVVLVVTTVVIVTSVSGSGSGCVTYPAAVRHDYATAMSDLSGRVPAATQAADLAQAASLANASAASAGQISVRTALFAMAGDLDEAHADVIAHRPVSPALLQRLTADGTALPASCAG